MIFFYCREVFGISKNVLRKPKSCIGLHTVRQEFIPNFDTAVMVFCKNTQIMANHFLAI